MKVVEKLKKHLPGDRVIVNTYELEAASHDESGMESRMPNVVIKPVNEIECLAAVQTCIDMGVPLTTRGAGTGLEGAAIPVSGGVVLDLTSMNRVVEKSIEDHFVMVEPGVVYDDLNRYLHDTGLFFPPSPGGSSDTATIGGMVATNASGIYAFRYGGTGRWVRSLRVITGRGEVLDLGTRAPKSSTGYNLSALFVGSEGTLGVITRIGLELAPLPNDRVQQAYSFPDLNQATAAAVEMAWAVPELAAIELLDQGTMGLIGDFLNENIPVKTSLFIEFHALNHVSPDTLALAADVADGYGGTTITVQEPWRIRYFGTRAVTTKYPSIVRTDAAVPLSRLQDYIQWAVDFAAPTPVYAFGHAGIGIVHLLMPTTPGDPDGKGKKFKKQAALTAIRMDGTVSGEHGIGLGNREPARAQYGNSLKYMHDLKHVFDPQGIMNPGKVL